MNVPFCVLLLLLSNAQVSAFFVPSSAVRVGARTAEKMVLHDVMVHLPLVHDASIHMGSMAQQHITHSWVDLGAQGLADAGSLAGKSPVCPAFGEPGWGPLCFLNGNPVFNAFDIFQESIQTSIVGLHDLLSKSGLENSYGVSIVLFTCLIRAILFPITFRQLASAEKTKALKPKLDEINEKYGDDPNLKNQMTALLYQETEVNPLAGCLPAIVQIPVFISLYRSFTNLAAQDLMREPFLWIPNLEGPVYGVRSIDWLTQNWVNGVPSLGWHDTALFLIMPVLLVLAQSVSLRILTPPSDDPQMQQTNRVLKYLPLLIGYFSLSVPAALGVYWFTSNVLSTAVSLGIKAYFKNNPEASLDIDLEKLANNQLSAFTNPAWGYKSKKQMEEEARNNVRPSRMPRIPPEFT